MALEDVINNYNQGGIGATWRDGQKFASDQSSSLAATAQKQAETNRYTQETPGSVAQVNNQAEASRIGNLPGQSKEAIGGYATEANTNKAQSQVSAAEAQAKWQTLPLETQNKVIDETHKRSMAVLSQAHDMLLSGTPTNKALDWMLQQYPQMQQDPQAMAMVNKYRNMPSDQAASQLGFTLDRLAASAATADPKHQGAMQIEDMNNTAAQTRAEIAANASKSNAATQAASATATAKLSSAQMLYNALQGANPKATKQEIDALYVKAATEITKTRPDITSPTGTSEEISMKGGGTSTPGTSNVKLTPAKIMQLRQNDSPQMRAYFDQAFGNGTSVAILGK